jgi:hypothetical protein
MAETPNTTSFLSAIHPPMAEWQKHQREDFRRRQNDIPRPLTDPTGALDPSTDGLLPD